MAKKKQPDSLTKLILQELSSFTLQKKKSNACKRYFLYYFHLTYSVIIVNSAKKGNMNLFVERNYNLYTGDDMNFLLLFGLNAGQIIHTPTGMCIRIKQI